MGNSVLTKMIHLSEETHGRLNVIAKSRDMTHDQILRMLLDGYESKDQVSKPTIPLATAGNLHKPLLQYSTGATLRIDKSGAPYVCSQDGKAWRRCTPGQVTLPWEVL